LNKLQKKVLEIKKIRKLQKILQKNTKILLFHILLLQETLFIAHFN
jgi:hypothetical protein